MMRRPGRPRGRKLPRDLAEFRERLLENLDRMEASGLLELGAPVVGGFPRVHWLNGAMTREDYERAITQALEVPPAAARRPPRQ